VSFKVDISAGEVFELIRPAALVVSALASIWVLSSARRHRFRDHIAIAWALATLFFPLITLPMYLIARFRRRDRRIQLADHPATLRWPVAMPLIYAVLVLSLIAVYLYRDQNSVDAHLASAAQAKVSGERKATIDGYRAALKLEDNAHTRKLLAIELANAGDWTEALFQFREAEQDGESDDFLSFNIARMLDALNLPNQAAVEYQRFLTGGACTQQLPDDRCALANARVQATLSPSASRPVRITKD
jgi:hypothetical protein